MNSNLTLIIFLILGPLLVLSLILINRVLALDKPNPEKLSPFECGLPPFSEPRQPFSVSFYIVALLFLIFDLEILFLYPLVMCFHLVSRIGYWVASLFLMILTVGFVYELARGVISLHPRSSNTGAQE